jgi:protein-disulfide isomerase
MRISVTVLVLGIGLVLAAGCRVPEEPGIARIEKGLEQINERLDGLDRKVDELAKAQPAKRADRPAIDPKKALETINLTSAPARGADPATVTIVEYSDFQCPYCLRVRPTLQKVLDEYPQQVSHVFKHFPLSFHKEAMNAHKAVAAAGLQGKFWEMHDEIFDSPKDLAPETMRKHAETLGLDMAKFDADYASPEIAKKIEDDQKEGRSIGVRGTPAFFVNGKYMAGAQPFEAFKREIDAALKKDDKKDA